MLRRSQAEAQRLDAQAKAVRIAVKRFLLGGGVEPAELVGAEDRFVDVTGAQVLGDDLDGLAERDDDDDLDGLGKERTPQDDVRLELRAAIRCLSTRVAKRRLRRSRKARPAFASCSWRERGWRLQWVRCVSRSSAPSVPWRSEKDLCDVKVYREIITASMFVDQRPEP